MNRKITGYQILSEIYETSNSLVFRGYRESDNQPVIFKILKEDYPTPAELTRYKQEYEITRSLNLDSIIKAYDLQKYQNTLVMILEDFGGKSLKVLMAERKITLEEFLRVGIKISESLSAIHAANIIHKDLNPSNIVFNRETGQLKIIDFGSSTVLLRENPTIRHPNVLEGTLAYMSPEQTGRMNRSLDYRTDFYSLGATFYEMLTQKLPFETSDAMELVHCHIAKEPLPPHEHMVEIPLAVSAIVMKLLAKTAEERYQSAWGLKSDLESCLNQLQATGHISNFSLGSQDISNKFQIPQKLYGREREIETLLAAFGRVAADSSTENSLVQQENSKSQVEMMLVTGYSGIGKSVLVQELYKPITQQKGYFSSGKFDQFQRNIPYSAVVRVFSELARQILTESESQLNNWREKLLAAFGQNGQVIIDVIPEVELIVGTQPPVQELGPTESQNRFNLVFQNFIQVFCQKEHPLVIFLDDLQWADSATLKLIQLIMTDENMQYLLMIGAYRDNEVSSTHPLIMTIDSLRKSGAIINQIILEPLKIEHINQLLLDSLKCDDLVVKPLADLIGRKTNCNPFFVNQFLKTLYQENLLNFSVPQAGSQGRWQWNIAQIEAMDISENVVELMLGKLKKFPLTTQQALRLAACVGNRFQLATLAIVHEKSAGETFRDLKSAIQEGLVIPTSELEIAPEELQTSDVQLLILNFKFLHDRVQQAAYALIDDEQKKAVHLKIGRLLLEKISPQERDTRIFEVADHLDVGRELVADRQELTELAKLNLEAGKKAKDATAYTAASQYFTAGLDCLRGNGWEENYELTLSLYKELADVEYLKGKFEQSEALINLTLERTKSALEKAEIYKLLIVQYTLRAKPLEAIQTGRKALKLVGVELPEEDLQTAVNIELEQAKENLKARDIASFINQQEVQDPEKKVALQLLANLAAPTFVADQALFPLVNLKASNLSLKYGPSSESPIGYANHGLVLVSLGDYRGGYELAMLAQKLTEKTNNLSQKCKIAVIVTTEIGIWVNHLRWADPILNAGYYAGLQAGELQWAGYILKYKLLNAFFQGKNLENLAKDIPNYLNFNEKTENNWAIDIILSGKAIIWNLTGIGSEKFCLKTDEISSKEQYIERCKSHQSFLGICTYNIFESQAFYLYGKYSEALQSALAAEKLLIYAVGHNQLAEHNFYSSLILAALYPDVLESEQKQYWNKLKSNQRQMKIWADNCPENNLHKYLLVAAEIARIAGENIEEVLELYDGAIASANKNDFIQNEALACELAAKFWLSKNKEDFAKLYMQKAHYGYVLWGAKRKVDDLQEKYPQLVGKTSAAQTKVKGTKTTASTTGTGSGEALDLATVVKASQAIAGEIVLDKLLAKLTNLVLENAGAQKGFLILSDNGILKIQAQGEIEREVQVLQSLPVSSSENLPLGIVNYVARTQENVVLSEATREGIFTNDPYILAHQPKSILCSAIVNQGKLTAILYLENNIAIGAFTPERLEVVKILSSQAAISLENAILYRTLEQKVDERTAQLASANQEITVLNERLKADNIRMSAELDVTRRLQQMILPKEGELSSIPELDIAGFMEPADEVGGDYYDVLQYGDRIKIGIGDVTGHGLESGVLMIMAQTAVRTLMVNNETDPVRFLNAINCTLYDNVNRMNCERNLSLCLLDYEEGTLRLSGQHEEVIVVRCSGEVERIDTMDLGFPIALDSDIADFILSAEVHLNPGDVVVLYTDGITEAKNEQGLLYGVEPLIESIGRNRDRTAEEIRQAAIDDLRHYIGEQKVFDDITLVILKQK